MNGVMSRSETLHDRVLESVRRFRAKAGNVIITLMTTHRLTQSETCRSSRLTLSPSVRAITSGFLKPRSPDRCTPRSASRIQVVNDWSLCK